MQKKKTASSEELYSELGHAFNFTQGDLAANRAGFLSHRQRKLEKSKFWQRIKLLLMIILVFALIAIVLGNVGLMMSNKCEPVPCNELSLIDKMERSLIGAGVLNLPALGLIIWVTINYFRDMRHGHVESLHSRVSSIKRVGGKSGTHYYLVSPKREFEISKPQYEFAWQAFPYTLYYLPFSKDIVAIEAAQASETGNKKLPAPKVPFGEYGKIFNFTQGDLEANRAGFISHEQKEEFQRVMIRGGMAMVFSGIILIACFVGILISYLIFASTGFEGNSIEAANFYASFGSLIFVFIFGAAFLWGYLAYKRGNRNSNESRVQIYDGFERYKQENKGVFLSLEKQKLLEEYPVRIYAAPATKDILSVHILLPE